MGSEPFINRVADLYSLTLSPLVIRCITLQFSEYTVVAFFIICVRNKLLLLVKLSAVFGDLSSWQENVVSGFNEVPYHGHGPMFKYTLFYSVFHVLLHKQGNDEIDDKYCSNNIIVNHSKI